ncbi:MAG: monothiol glutaredoxin [Candidatus Deianiraeaceae bacterium]|jgi:monothiol glutaredoxin
MDSNSSTFKRIQNDITKNDIVLYMKGTKMFPQCGFSSVVVSILQNLGVDFTDINVLDDDEIRQGIKEFSDWPTVPQLYYKGEFVGGCDIIREMFQSSELHELFGIKK